MHYQTIKKNADLDAALGSQLSKAVRELRKPTMARLPSSVSFTGSKPQFHLNDGGTLHAYSVDLQTMAVMGKRYCGSADTAIHHAAEQFAEGYQPPENTALLFVETYWNGRNTGWSVTVVTRNLQTLLTA